MIISDSVLVIKIVVLAASKNYIHWKTLGSTIPTFSFKSESNVRSTKYSTTIKDSSICKLRSGTQILFSLLKYVNHRILQIK